MALRTLPLMFSSIAATFGREIWKAARQMLRSHLRHSMLKSERALFRSCSFEAAQLDGLWKASLEANFSIKDE